MAASVALSRTFTNLLYPGMMASRSTFVPGPAERVRALNGVVSANPLSLAMAVLALTVAVQAFGTVDSDVSWQLWIAHQINGGVRLYTDIVETNPPLWFWMAIPVDWLSALTGVRSDHLLIVVIGCAAAVSLAATNRLLSSVVTAQRSWLLAYAALVVVAMPWLQAGQKEQIALLGAVPYAALVAARRQCRPVSPRLAFAVGACAALGFALKHYFLLVPVLLELWLLAGQRKSWRALRPETVAIAAIGILYAAAVAIFASDYVTTALPLVLLAYGVTGAQHIVSLFQPAVLTALATLALLLAYLRVLRSACGGFASALAVAAIGFGAAYFIQDKGWHYQAVPFAGCAAIALAGALTAEAKPRLVSIAAPALLCLPFWIMAEQAKREGPIQSDVRQAVKGLQPGDSVGFIGADPALGWTVTLQERFRYPSRYNGFWMMRAVTANEAAAAPDPLLTELGRRVVRETVEDFRCLPPKRIIIARPPAATESGEFDILRFFLRDPEFARLIAHYRPIQRTSVEVFEQALPLDAGVNCIRRAGG